MNTFVASPTLALSIAHHTIDERVAARRAAQRNAPRLSARPREHYRLPWWAFRFPRPAH